MSDDTNTDALVVTAKEGICGVDIIERIEARRAINALAARARAADQLEAALIEVTDIAGSYDLAPFERHVVEKARALAHDTERPQDAAPGLGATPTPSGASGEGNEPGTGAAARVVIAAREYRRLQGLLSIPPPFGGLTPADLDFARKRLDEEIAAHDTEAQ